VIGTFGPAPCGAAGIPSIREVVELATEVEAARRR